LNNETKADLCILLGVGFILAAVFLMFREYGMATQGEQGLLPLVIATGVIGIIFLAAYAVLKSLTRE